MLEFIESNNGKTFELKGTLTRHSIVKSTEKKISSLVQRAHCQLDFSAVSRVDTAGLAWVLLLLERANKHNCEVSLLNVSKEMMKLAKLSAVESFLPIK